MPAARAKENLISRNYQLVKDGLLSINLLSAIRAKSKPAEEIVKVNECKSLLEGRSSLNAAWSVKRSGRRQLR